MLILVKIKGNQEVSVVREILIKLNDNKETKLEKEIGKVT